MAENGAQSVRRRFEPWVELHGKIVMVTGASSGIGRELCLDLAKAGCRIIAAARRIDRLLSLWDEINAGFCSAETDKDSIRAVAVELDIGANEASIEHAVEKAWLGFGKIDALINNAGVRGTVHYPLDLSEEEWNSTMATNMRGTWLVSKHVCKRMRDAHQGGSLINISSVAGLNRGHLPGTFAYAASKAGVNSMTKTMALELGRYNIRVNSISPGIFKSEITEALMKKEWLKRVASRTIPLQTHGTSDPAITSLVRYLIHDSSEYITEIFSSSKLVLPYQVFPCFPLCRYGVSSSGIINQALVFLNSESQVIVMCNIS